MVTCHGPRSASDVPGLTGLEGAATGQWESAV